LISHRDTQSHIRSIYDSTIAITFLGTPHGGADLANWGRLLGYNIIDLLRPQSEVHDRINEGFHKVLKDSEQRRRGPLKVVCFFEELPVSGVGEVSLKILS
jgi:protein SERAC1